MNVPKVNIDFYRTLTRQQLTIADVAPDSHERFTQHGMDFTKNLDLKGKYCYHPFNSVTIDSKGDCYVCVCQAWLPISVGNILDFESLSDIVRSPKAREIQASILDGSYKYCDHETCHLIKGNQLENRIDHRPDTINWIVFAIDDSCNLSCPSCRTHMIFHKEGPDFDRRMAISSHITKLIQNHRQFLKFTLSGDGDPFASHVYRNILENLQLTEQDPIEIEIVTNGILIKSHWDRMKGIHNHVTRFKISFDAGTPETYSITRRQGDWDKLLENSEYIIKWKQKHYSQMEIVANFVVQNTNYRDIHQYVILTKNLGFDEISFQKVTDWGKWRVDGVNTFVDHAVWMETHPNYKELTTILNDPLLDDRKIKLTNLSTLRTGQPAMLEDLVNLKLKLQQNQTIEKLRKQLTQLKHFYVTSQVNLHYSQQTASIEQACVKLLQEINQLADQHHEIIASIDRDIAKKTENYYSRGYIINGFVATDGTDVAGENLRKLPFAQNETRDLVVAQIGKYTNWKYPGLEIGPGNGEWTEHLVANEPLYLVDTHEHFLTETKTKFNGHFQNKIRSYLTTGTDLSMLPQNQFGFVFSWNVFNYLTLDLIEQYLESIYKVLRPGGVAMFSYNNAERPLCARYVDTGYMSYAPKSKLLEVVAKYEFEVISLQDLEEYISWIEIRKPGELSSIKVHPVMGTVMEK